MLAGVIGGVAGGFAHGITESNLFYLGVGFSFFILLAIGLQLSSQASSPEFLPQQVRGGLALLCFLPLVAMILAGQAELSRANVATAVAVQNREALESSLASLGTDPESQYQRGIYGARSPQERVELLQQAVKGLPTTRNLRALARAYGEVEKFSEAEQALRRALTIDPNNLATHALLWQTQLARGDQAGAIATAQKLVELESTTSFKVRAIPELIPLETYEARAFLAKNSPSNTERLKLLQEAVTGFTLYLERTFPRAETFPGEGKEEAQRKMQRGLELANEAAILAQQLADTQSEEALKSAARRFSEALASAG
jgi:tetratricopeptide (TPR) repeat protein